jgi:hypothetical protein
MTTGSGRKVRTLEREREKREERRERNNAKYYGHLRLCQQPRAVHALRSDQQKPLDGGDERYGQEVGKRWHISSLLSQAQEVRLGKKKTEIIFILNWL